MELSRRELETGHNKRSKTLKPNPEIISKTKPPRRRETNESVIVSKEFAELKADKVKPETLESKTNPRTK